MQVPDRDASEIHIPTERACLLFEGGFQPDSRKGRNCLSVETPEYSGAVAMQKYSFIVLYTSTPEDLIVAILQQYNEIEVKVDFPQS